MSGGEGAGGAGKRGQGWLGVGCGWLKLRQGGKRVGVMCVVPVCVCVVWVGHDTFFSLRCHDGNQFKILSLAVAKVPTS